MNEIIKVNEETMTVSARDLHESLGVASRFSRWFSDNKTLFVEGEDYNKCTSGTVVGNGAVRELEDYSISILMAKHIALMSRTEKGKEIRDYLIDLERAWNTPEQIMARALKIADRTIASLKAENRVLIEDNERMKPKEEFFDTVADSKTAISMNEVAKVLDYEGYGRNKLFQFLRDQKILNEWNVPYQRYVDSGWFRVIEQHYSKNGEPQVTTKTLVYQKGVNKIRELLDKHGKRRLF